jgi:putative AdoMet-dependent methyltransferase
MLDSKGFDQWADSYDESIAKSKGYPFEGYYDILNFVYNQVGISVNTKVLDLGFGTGTLTHRLYQDGAKIYGIDFSTNMLNLAKEKMPYGHFIKADLAHGLPHEILNEKFDFIISTYAIHHLVGDNKVNLIAELKDLLIPGGKIIIADVSFKTVHDLEKCRQENIDVWDNDEFYIVFEDIRDLLKSRGLNSDYFQLSSCAGVLIIN